MNKIITLAIALLFCHSLSAQDSHQALQDAFMDALRANDAAALGALYAPDAVSFDLAAQRLDGPAAIANAWGGFFSQFRVLEADLINPHLEIHGDTGVAWGEFAMRFEPVEGGEAMEMKGRYSDVTRNIDGRWLYVMDHVSVPAPGEEEPAAE
jgi:uncharacterized protein (TIGR02246 family)